MRKPIRLVLQVEQPTVTPLAYVARSARPIAEAGSGAISAGGSALVAARPALPNIGLIGLRDMVEGLRDEGGATPSLSPRELGATGFQHVSCPATLIFRITGLMTDTLRALHAAGLGEGEMGADAARASLHAAVGLKRWRTCETTPAGITETP